MLSIVIPVHNEEPSLLPLYDRLTAVLEALQKPYEILFVDDASTDRSFELLANLVETDERLKVIRLRRNFGQTAALSAGFHEAEGEVIIAMDGDLQHAPEDIPALLRKIDEGYDIASGWRKERVDNALTRKTPRTTGDSHYGLGRTFRVLFDILTIKFLLKYFTRPMHFFGALGLAGTGSGGLILSYLAVRKLMGDELVMAHGPLMMAGGLLLLAGLMMFSTGLLGEVLIRTYFETQDRRIYAVRQILAKKERRAASR